MTDSAIFTTMAGLQAINAQMDSASSNLANSQTAGYAAVQAASEAAPYSGAAAPVGADAVALLPGPDTTLGPLNHTGDPLNVGLGGDAWLQVQGPSGPALTRNGSLQISSGGLLTDDAGNAVLNASGAPISLPRLGAISIGADGTISGVPAGQPGAPAQAFGQLALMATPAGGLKALGGSLFAPVAGAALAPSADGSVHQGFLNGSNVDTTQSMMTLIANSRSYQLQTELLKQQGAGGTALNTLLAQG
jgi:flagellar basal-body rod protein FlgF